MAWFVVSEEWTRISIVCLRTRNFFLNKRFCALGHWGRWRVSVHDQFSEQDDRAEEVHVYPPEEDPRHENNIYD